MDQKKLRNLMRAFITSQFQYCPLIWMFHSRQLNQKIDKIQGRAPRITYKDTESTFSELLQKDCAVTIHTKNLQIFMTEMYETNNELNPSFMQEIFRENTTHYNLRNNNEFTQPRVRSVSKGQKTSDLKVRNCGKRYHQPYGIQKPFVNLKKGLKIGTEKIVPANYAAFSFQTWAIYDDCF